MATSITSREKALLERILKSDFHNGAKEKDWVVGNYVWTFSCVDGSKEDTGTLSSLIKKELVDIFNAGKRDSAICITEAGWEALHSEQPVEA